MTTLYVTGERVRWIPDEPSDPEGPWKCAMAQTEVTATTVGPRVPIKVQLDAVNNGEIPLVCPVTESTTTNGERGVDWDLYASLTGGVPYTADYFEIPVGQKDHTLYLQCDQGTDVTAAPTLTLAETGEDATPITPNVLEVGTPSELTMNLSGALTTDEAIGWNTTTQTVNEHEVASAAVVTTQASDGCSFVVTPTGTATFGTDYSVAYTIFAGTVNTGTGVLLGGAQTITLASGDTHVGFLFQPVSDETTEAGETIILTLSGHSGCVPESTASQTLTVTINDTSRGPAVVSWDPVQTVITEPYDGSGNPISQDVLVGYVVLSSLDPINDVSVDLVADSDTATNADYALLTTSVTIPAGTGVQDGDGQPVFLRVSGNDGYEETETLSISIENLTSNHGGPHTIDTTGGGVLDVTILNIDPAPVIEWVATTASHDTTGLFTSFVRMTNLSNRTHSVTVSAPIGSSGTAFDAGDPVTPLTETVLTFPAGQTTTQPFVYTVSSLPSTGTSEWRYSLSNATNGATLGTQNDFEITLSQPLVIPVELGFQLTQDGHIESDTLIRQNVLRIANGIPLTAAATVTIEAVTSPAGSQATYGTDWDFVTQGGTTITPTSTSPLQWDVTVPAGANSALRLYYKLPEGTADEPVENFRWEIVRVVSGDSQDVVRGPSSTFDVAITDSDPATTTEALHGLAPVRQAFDANDADIVVSKFGNGAAGGLITYKLYPPQGIPSDQYASAGGGVAAFTYDTSNSGVVVAARFARHIWALKNTGIVSGYVNPWDDTDTQAASGLDDAAWLQDRSHFPTEGLHPVTIKLDGSNGFSDFHAENGTGATTLVFNDTSNNTATVNWNEPIGLPHVRDLIIFGDGMTNTECPGPNYKGFAQSHNNEGFPSVPGETGSDQWAAACDNVRFEGAALKYLRNPSQTAAGVGTQPLKVFKFADQGLLKVYDCHIFGADTAYPQGGAEVYMKWGANWNSSSMPDFRGNFFNSCAEHCTYMKHSRPHGYFIGNWQHWHGNGYNANASQFFRHVDWGLNNSNVGSSYSSGGLVNSLLLCLGCHARNNGYNIPIDAGMPGDGDWKIEGFNGTVILRDNIATGRWGNSGPLGQTDGRSDRGSLRLAFRAPDGSSQSGNVSFNGVPAFDYGDQTDQAAFTVMYQAWPMGHPSHFNGHTETMAATTDLVHVQPHSSGNGRPGSRFYAQDSNALGNPVEYQDFGPNWWHFRKFIMWNHTVRQDLAPADGSGSNKGLFWVAGVRQFVWRVDDNITATAPNGGVDFEGNAIGADEPITGTIRMLGGQTQNQMAMRSYGSGSQRLGVGLWQWELESGGNVSDHAFWNTGASQGAKLLHGEIAGEASTPGQVNDTLTDAEIDVYDGDDPA